MPTKVLRTTALLICGLLTAGATSAQSLEEPPTGSLLRLTAPSIGRRPFVGRLLQSGAEDLTILYGDKPTTIRRDAISKLEWSLGRRSRARQGALWGAGVGALMMARVAHVSANDGIDEGAVWELGGALVVLAIGVGSGAWIGSKIKTDDWKVVPVFGAKIALGPSRHGLGANLTFSW